MPVHAPSAKPWHPGVGQRGAASLFKEQVIFLASLAVCAGWLTQTSHGTEQNNPLSSTSAGASVTTNPSQPARSLCQSHKDTEP